MTTLRPLTGIAKRVHDDIMGLDPEGARLYAQMVIAGALQHDMEAHEDLLQHRVDRIIAKRAQTIQKSLAVSISKGRGGEGALAAAAVISKAGFTDFTAAQRREYVRNQDRDPSGQFKTMHRKINYRTDQPMPGRLAERHGIPHIKNLKDDERARYQQAYTQVADLVGQFADAPAGTASLHLTYRTPEGTYEHVLKPVDAGEFGPVKGTGRAKSANLPHPIPGNRFEGGGRLVDAQVIVDGGLTAQGAAFNLVGALAGTTAAGRATHLLDQDPANGDKFVGAERLKSFGDEWDRYLEDDINNPANRVFRRIGSGSRLLTEIAGDNIPSQAKLALKTAEAVGAYGPEAQKVIGPHADRAAYRYRGVERKPEPGLQNAVTSFTQRFGADDGRKGLLYGRQEEVVTRQGTRLDFKESPIVGYFQGRLADKDLIHLQRKSGVIPPSEGIIIDKNGKVVTQAVGYGDDWYLPFNLKTLSKVKGGDYIRTRTWGGVTTEDIYAGLMSGARSVTVVSHNGVYTVEFDPAFKGKRRFNDKAGRMVKRYGHLLDAVKSKDVTLADIPHERKVELREQAALEGDPHGDRAERERFTAKYRELEEDERKDPQLAAASRRVLAEEFLNEKASNLVTSDGKTAGWDALAHGYVARNVAAERAVFEQQMGSPDEIARMRALGVGVTTFDEEQAKRAASGRVSDPESAILALGYEKEWADKLANAEADYRESLSPLRLDGAGYDKALKALQEQFPYYIANVSWQPNLRGGFDHGYVKPRFNRPEGATAGYYDPSILGTGKVTADRTRFQNHGVKVVARPKVEDTDEAPVDAPAQAAAVARPADRKAALKEIWQQVQDATAFGPGSKAPGQAIPAAFWNDKTSPEGQAASLLRMPWDDVLDAIDTPQGYDNYAKAAETLAPVLGLNNAKVRTLRNPEKEAAGVPFSLERAAESSSKTFAFGEEYGPNRRPELYDRVIQRGLHAIKADAKYGKQPAETLDDYIGRMQKLSELADDPAATAIHTGDKPRFERLGMAAAQVRQAERFKAEAEAKVKEIDGQLNHELDKIKAATDIVVVDQEGKPTGREIGGLDNGKVYRPGDET